MGAVGPIQARGASERPADTSPPVAAGPGQPLDEETRARMEASFGADFSAVRVHEGPAAEAMGAVAVAQGDAIHVRPGAYDPRSPAGLELLGHELAHVVQQRQGRVAAPQGKGGLVIDAALEAEADAAGALAASGDRVPGAANVPATTRADRAQPKILVERAKAAAISTFVGSLSLAVEKAHAYVLHVPTLGPYADLDGHTQHWVEAWAARLTSAALLPAAFGYAIESLTTLVYLPAAPPGLSIVLQGTRGPTRPDIILAKDGVDVAWIDITSDGSPAHIDGKVGWAQSPLHIAEVGYTAMAMEHFNPTPNYKDDVDPGALKLRLQFATWLTAQRRTAWKALGDDFRAPRKRERLTWDDDGLARTEGEGSKAIRKKLASYFGAPIDGRTAASVLTVMGVSPESWGMTHSVSRTSGESYLLEHDPRLVHAEIPSPSPRTDAPLLERYQQHLATAEGAQTLAMDSSGDEALAAPQGALAAPGNAVAASDDAAMDLGALEVMSTVDVTLPPGLALGPMVATVADGLGAYLLTNGLSLAVSLDDGASFASRALFAPGADFAANLVRFIAELPPEATAKDGKDGKDGKESGGFGPATRPGQLARRRLRMTVYRRPDAPAVAPPALPSLLGSFTS